MSAETGASILETESYIVALVFLAFLALFVVFERLLEWRRASYKRRHKLGLLAALDAMTTELMLFGLASLLLNVFEGPITSICIHAPSSSSWTILSQLNGCDCCLKNTNFITECYLESESCGPQLCNCNDADPNCLVGSQAEGEAGERRLLAASPMLGQRQLLQDSSDSTQCVGISEYSQQECGNRPGYKQALSANAIHQIHMFLFFIAFSHIVCSNVMIRISTARVQIWKHWLAGDDAHSKAVHQALQQHADQARPHKPNPNAAAPNSDCQKQSVEPVPDETGATASAVETQHLRLDALPCKASSACSLLGGSGSSTDPAQNHSQQPSVGAATSSHKRSDEGGVDNGSNAFAGAARGFVTPAFLSRQSANESATVLSECQVYADEQAHDTSASGAATACSNEVDSQAAVGNMITGRLDHDITHMLRFQIQKRVGLAKQSVTGRSQQAVQLHSSKRHSQGAEGHLPESAEGSFSGSEAHAKKAEAGLHGAESNLCVADEVSAAQQAAAQSDDVQLDIRLPDEVLVEQAAQWAGRQQKLERRRQYSWEWGTCFLCQFCLQTIQHAEISIMRASFILTHRPGKKFNFMDYILASMDDDCAKVVGLGPTVWLIVVIFVLLAGVIGWASAWFTLLAVILELIMNTKLIYIARHTARGGAVHRLKPTIFWFGAKGPWVMLTVIKTLLFLCSFIYASCIFFAINFGHKSCFFTTPGLYSRSLPIPWWVVLIANTVVYFALSFITVPLYSLGVQMGSDFRPHLLPTTVKDRLLDIANANKEKVRQRKLQAAGGTNSSKLRKLSGVRVQRLKRRRVSSTP